MRCSTPLPTDWACTPCRCVFRQEQLGCAICERGQYKVQRQHGLHPVLVHGPYAAVPASNAKYPVRTGFLFRARPAVAEAAGERLGESLTGVTWRTLPYGTGSSSSGISGSRLRQARSTTTRRRKPCGCSTASSLEAQWHAAHDFRDSEISRTPVDGGGSHPRRPDRLDEKRQRALTRDRRRGPGPASPRPNLLGLSSGATIDFSRGVLTLWQLTCPQF